MTLLIPAIYVSNVFTLAALFAISTFCYAAWSTMDIVLPSDLYPSETVATVAGMSSTGAGIGTIISTLLIGYVSDHYSFAPILVAASLIPLAATAVVFLLVRRPIPPAIVPARYNH
jgi:ACS family hexuronate transporter-like MFS transporter